MVNNPFGKWICHKFIDKSTRKIIKTFGPSSIMTMPRPGEFVELDGLEYKVEKAVHHLDDDSKKNYIRYLVVKHE